jgi:hypothetical protein
MPEVDLILSPGQDYPLRELAETVRYELELQDVPSAVTLGGFPVPVDGRVPILIDPLGYLSAQGQLALPADPILRRTIFLCPGRQAAPTAPYLELLRRAGSVFVTDQRSVVALHRNGIPARLMRPGYSKLRDRFDPDATRSVDVMFLGRESLRRTRYLNHAAKVLSRRNCLLQLSPDEVTSGPTGSFLADGRWPLLAATKVLMLLHHDDDPEFEWQAALDAVHAGAVVVTEQSAGISPLVPGRHLVVAAPESLPYVIDGLLSDEERLAELRIAAHERLSQWIPFALSVSILRAAVVELVGEPIAPGAALMGTGLTLQSDGDTPASPVASADRGELERIQRQLGETQRESSDLRRRLASLQETVRSIRGRGWNLRTAHESSAWRARRDVRVSALTITRGDDKRLAETLDSLSASRLWDYEVIVVNVQPGGTASGRGLAERWMSSHPRVAARLIECRLDPGRGAARNIALDFARGRHCLLLDPGDAIYPRCLDVLSGTLDGIPDVAFAYPIQEVTGQVDAFVAAGGDNLLSYLGWDPGRLRSGNLIHAPVLIDTGRLRELGGFTSEPLLDGLDEYDLWCRMAERDWRGQLVPQMLARRSESGLSPVLVERKPAPGPAMISLQARSPSFLAPVVSG